MWGKYQQASRHDQTERPTLISLRFLFLPIAFVGINITPDPSPGSTHNVKDTPKLRPIAKLPYVLVLAVLS